MNATASLTRLRFAAAVLLAACSLFAAPTRESCHAWLDVDTGAYAHNVREFKKIIGDKTGICAIMKANAYGLTTVPDGSIRWKVWRKPVADYLQ